MYTYTSTKKKEWMFWFITWTWYKHHVQISEYLRTRRTRITFETLFFMIYVKFIQKWEPRLGPDVEEKRSGKGKDLKTRIGKGKGREG